MPSEAIERARAKAEALRTVARNIGTHTSTIMATRAGLCGEADVIDAVADLAASLEAGPAEIPRHLRIALANAQRAFENDDPRTLAAVHEDLQGLVDAALAYASRRAAKAAGAQAERRTAEHGDTD